MIAGVSARSSSASPEARERLVEREQRLESSRVDEALPRDRARVLDVVDGAGRRVEEAELEEAAEQGARHELRERQRRPARLVDGDLQRYFAGPGDVEHAPQLPLEGQRDR